MRAGNPYIASARSDEQDRLVEAEEPLASLQHRCGGAIPGTIAAPALLELVRKARSYNLRIARSIHVQDEQDSITAWVEVTPEEGDGAGCAITLANWRSTPLAVEDPAAAIQMKTEIDRHLAEAFIRLDPQQKILSAEAKSSELAGLIERLRAGVGQPWTDFVEIKGAQYHQPLHWRLLDGAHVKLPGSSRDWTVGLAPMGAPETGASGFDLYFVPDQPPRDALPKAAGPQAAQVIAGVTMGREIAPVLRQPIARIIANAETIRTRLAGPIVEEYSRYAADIAAAGEHLLALIEDLTDLEVVEAAEFSTAPDIVDLGDLARRAAGILAMRAQERGISIDAPDADEKLPAVGEFRRVLQVLLNLIGNAIRYSPEDSQIWVRIEGESERARIIVADQGQGLNPEQQRAIFEKFERLGRSGDGGSGLGLYISRKLARAMGGELTVESAPGQGARFILDLPACE